MPNTENDDIEHQAILELEEDHWVSSKWNKPDAAEVSWLSSSQGEDSGSDDGSGGDEDSRDQFFQNDYVKKLWDTASLNTMQPGEVHEAMEGTNPELGLFHLFFSKTFLDTLWRWTNKLL